MPINYFSIILYKLIRVVLKSNLSLSWIGVDGVISDECKDAISNKCWTPVHSSRCLYKQHCYCQSKHVQLSFHIMFFLFTNVIGTTTRTWKIINYKRITQSSCFIFGVAIKPNFINIILGLKSNGTSFDAVRFNFAQTRLE